MKVIGILGSPRRGGNTEVLLDRALAGALEAGADTEKLALCDYDFSGCNECNDCMDTGFCTIVDEMDVIYEAIERADRVIFASPMFFMGVPAHAKAAIDRCQCYWALKYVLKQKFPRQPGSPARYGSFIGVGGTKGSNLFDGSILTLKYFFDAISVTPREELYVLVRGMDEKGAVETREEELLTAQASGMRLATLE